VLATRDVLVLSVLRARPAQEAFWEQFARALARLHTSTVHDRFGWERDNCLGRCRQENAWTADGYEFFAQRRLLRWLPERRVQAALDERDRRALERLCARHPPLQPAADWPGVHFPAFPNTAPSSPSASATVLPPPCHRTLTALLLARD
jgi:fructosamine-3-kinase